MSQYNPERNAALFNQMSAGHLPGLMGWDAEVKHRDTGKTIALFRCTQMIL
ncbi:hypothetical protein [Caenimonas soli]|uniref:hypothetical protein n=1 Tax=Caenimonas soli TaxID=2735555 RepID=UPI001A9B9C38|nr:hypothetical protein [Caenimonas soli]